MRGKIKNLKVSVFGRLLIGIIAILILISVITAVGIGGINMLEKTSGDILNESIQQSKLQSLKVNLDRLIMPANDYLIHGNVIEISNFEQLLKENYAQLNQCKEHVRDENEYLVVKETEKDLNKIENLSYKIFRLKDPVGNDDGTVMMEQMDSIAQHLSKRIDAALNIQFQEIKAFIKVKQAASVKAHRIIIIVGLFTAISLLFGGFIYVREITRPIKHLLETAEKISSGDLSVKADVKTSTRDEIEDFAKSFNNMIGVLEKNTVSRDYFNAIISKMADSLVITGENGLIRIINNATAGLLGYSENELIGKPLGVIFRNSGNGTTDMEIDYKEVNNIYNTYYSKEGKPIPVMFSSSVMHNKENKVSGMICIASHNEVSKRNNHDHEEAETRNIKAFGDVPLTNRELEIIKLIAEGVSNRNIADKLFISVRTVETHRRNIMKKLQVRSVIALVHYAAQSAII